MPFAHGDEKGIWFGYQGLFVFLCCSSIGKSQQGIWDGLDIILTELKIDDG